jgi:hypothetical protein
MEYLIIYDSEGTIFFNGSGSVSEPVGVPFLRVSVPVEKMVTKIDTTKNPHEPIFVDIPKNAVDNEIEQLKLMVADLALNQGGML